MKSMVEIGGGGPDENSPTFRGPSGRGGSQANKAARIAQALAHTR